MNKLSGLATLFFGSIILFAAGIFVANYHHDMCGNMGMDCLMQLIFGIGMIIISVLVGIPSFFLLIKSLSSD